MLSLAGAGADGLSPIHVRRERLLDGLLFASSHTLADTLYKRKRQIGTTSPDGLPLWTMAFPLLQQHYEALNSNGMAWHFLPATITHTRPLLAFTQHFLFLLLSLLVCGEVLLD